MNALNLPSLLDVLLSLTFVFFIVSMFVSGIWEFISTIFRDKRATLLNNSLRHLLSDPAFAELIYEHPLIRGLLIRRKLQPLERLFRRFLSREIDAATGQILLRPSYIDPKVFARVLLGLVQKHASPALVDNPPALVPVNLTQLAAWIGALPASSLPITPAARRELQSILTALTQDADGLNGGMGKVLSTVETWYNAYMDRVSGYFKQYSQRGIRWVAIIVVVLFNIDALHLTVRLYRDPVLRALTVGQATAVVRAVGDTLNKTVARRVLAEQGVEQQFRRDSAKRAGLAPDTLRRLMDRRDSLLTRINHQAQTRSDSLDRYRTQLTGESLGLQQLPIGWGTFWQDVKDPANGGWGWFIVKMLAGWVLMVAAVSFGAPFWFDILVKLVNIRNVGKKPETDSGKS